ncbi:MAG: cytochrome c family protein [Thermodesulfobacteriota bacterium]|nr:cytochrome c family protein [Thermodesulfobacteriota bacterium]
MRYFFTVFTAILMIIIFIPEKVRGGNNAEIPKYIGSEACKACHQKEYRSFTQYAKKSTSFESIQRVKKGLTEEEIKKCYFCHTTGYGKPSGFVSLEETPHLKNAGCEVCHGPGEFHVKKKSPEYIKKSLTMKDCEVCHISERVKAFRYKPMIHGGAH